MTDDSLFVVTLRKLLLDAVILVPVSPEDDRRISELKKKRRLWETNLAQTAKRLGRQFSPATWATLVGACLYQWDEGGRTIASDLAPGGKLDVPYDREEGSEIADSLRRSAANLIGLEDKPTKEKAHQTVPPLMTLSRYALSRGSDDLAYDLLHYSVALVPDDDPLLSSVAELGLKLALAGGKPVQIAIMSTKAAVAAVVAVRDDPGLRLAAYDACEVAIERIAMTEEHLRVGVAEMLMSVLESRDWLKHLRVRLIPSISTPDGKARYREILGAPDWPPRVADLDGGDPLGYMPSIFHLMRAEVDFENERLRLAPLVEKHQVTTSEVDWRFSITDFQQAVPHSGSLLKDREFSKQLVLLTHEISHVLSFLGGIGAALTAFRVAGLEVATQLWRVPKGTAPEVIQSNSIRGISDLEPGDAMLLLPVERQLEIRKKSRALVDTWTPWLEGIAVLGELGADPTLDPLGINPVTDCLRNLTDFSYDEKDKRPAREQVLAHFSEFEKRCSEALQEIGPGRIEDYLRHEEEPYFHGYVAVRALMSRWRLTANRNLSSTECFDLLLHATRHGTHEYIPDLSLGSEEFLTAAREGMARFAAHLAELPAQDIDIYLARQDASAPSRLVMWKSGRLVPLSEEQTANIHNQQELHIRSMIDQALQTLTDPSDARRFIPHSAEEEAFHSAATLVERRRVTERWADEAFKKRSVALFHAFFDLGLILPIGQCSSVFFLHHYKDPGYSRIYLNVRTTKSHVDSGEASYNGIWFPLSAEDGQNLARAYRQHAVPRLLIARIVMLSDLEIGKDDKFRFPHFFALEYPDWFGIIGTSGWVQAIESMAPDVWKGCLNLIRRRLQGDDVTSIERRLIASGDELVERMLKWLNESDRWYFQGNTYDLGGWFDHLKSAARSLFDPNARAAEHKTSRATLLVAVFGDCEWTRTLNRSSFAELTRRVPGKRLEYAKALYDTALHACESLFLELNANRVSIDGISLFQEGPSGWDVIPAVSAEKNQ